MSDSIKTPKQRSAEILNELGEAISKAKHDLEQMADEYSMQCTCPHTDTVVRDWVVIIGNVGLDEDGDFQFPVMTLTPHNQPDYVGRGLLSDADLHLEAGSVMDMDDDA